MYEKFVWYILLPIAFGIMIALTVSGANKDVALRQYLTARTHQILHELENSGCEHIDFSEWSEVKELGK